MSTRSAVLTGPTAGVADHPTDRPTDHPAGRPTPPAGTARFAPVAWTPWSTRHPIATAGHELEFVADLSAACDGATAPHTRSDTTAVLNALRGGLTWGELSEFLPGVRPARLLGAYQALDALRLDALDAWDGIVAGSDLAALERHGDRAARLLPVLVDRLRRWATNDPAQLAGVIGLNDAGAAGVTRAIEEIERRIAASDDHDLALALSQTLYSMNGDCLFGRPDHLPSRVGSLMPTHVSGLLGERAVTTAEARVA